TFLQYILPLNIKYKVNFAVSKYDANTHSFTPESVLVNPKNQATRLVGKTYRNVERTSNSNLNTSFFQTLNWTKKLADIHDINLLLGFSMEAFDNSNFNGYIEGFLGNELSELNAGTINKDVGGTSSDSRLMSYFGRSNYSFDDKYLFEFNSRYDGSSRFPGDLRWGFFPSAGVGYNIAKENFFAPLATVVNHMKIRATYGSLGNSNVGYYYVPTVAKAQTNFIGPNGTYLDYVSAPGLGNYGLTWEKPTTLNVAGATLFTFHRAQRGNYKS
ncbi:MAG: TonB-dependent receptor plug, partial [Parcubacteria group bacterium GW2011_GWC2_52_8c]